ncbi:acyltransferase family protein [Dyella mobilis]|uniref:Acyltransferase n=1 Tax=Dyella mobilis TaxID=1849582 RepID=A0ABS2KE98_9GAMM|nr:acyltransferase [Dyella mobilis]MBM7129496.1 acyltransferase [Dyella mobilis]GLQ98240.1 acyltransferase [Dyella mobilis]
MERKPGLDLLRAVAILWVMPFHSYLAGYTGGGVLRWSGWMGVDLFFALSGFLIGSQVFNALASRGRVDFVDFYLRRCFRTLPAYFVVLAVYVAWPSLREEPGMMPLWQFLTYTLNLFIDPNRGAFSHAWSLCVEEQFYLVFPLLALLLARKGRLGRGVAVIAALILGGIVLRAWLWLHAVGPVEAKGGDDGVTYLKLLYYPTYARLDDLLGGIALAAARSYRTRGWAWIERNANVVLLAGVVLTGLCMWGFNGQQRFGFAANVFGYPMLALAMTALVAGAAGQRSVLSRIRIPGAAWFAAASYSLYLTHKMVYGQLHGRFAPWVDGHGIWTALIYAAAVLATGAALHYLVERPCLRLREPVRRMWARRESRYATTPIA